MKSHVLLVALAFLIASVVGTASIMTSTTPDEIGPVGLAGFFGVLYVGAMAAIFIVIRSLQHLADRTVPTMQTLTRSAVLAIAPVMLLALNTLRQLTMIDLLLVLVFEAILLFYAARLRGEKS